MLFILKYHFEGIFERENIMSSKEISAFVLKNFGHILLWYVMFIRVEVI